jgi:hypothetical protein
MTDGEPFRVGRGYSLAVNMGTLCPLLSGYFVPTTKRDFLGSPAFAALPRDKGAAQIVDLRALLPRSP